MVECEICSRKFSATDHLRQHIISSLEHAPEHQVLSCQRCNGKVFISASSKRHHLLDSPRHHVCALCPEHWDLKTEDQLKQHFKAEHPGMAQGSVQLNAGEPFDVTEVPRKGVAQAQKPLKKERRVKKALAAPTLTSPLDVFFAAYPSFDYNPRLPPSTSYEALVRHVEWDRHSVEGKETKKQYQEALKKEVGVWFGREDDPEAWKTLCRAVGITDAPNSIQGCAKVLRNTHVNIVDLIQWGRSGTSGSVKVFKTQKELVNYSFDNGKIFPSSEVQADGETNVVIRHLLRKMRRSARH